MEKPFVLIFCPGGLVPQNDLPHFATLAEAVAKGLLENYTTEDTAFVLELTDTGTKVVYEFGEDDVDWKYDVDYEEEDD